MREVPLLIPLSLVPTRLVYNLPSMKGKLKIKSRAKQLIYSFYRTEPSKGCPPKKEGGLNGKGTTRLQHSRVL